MAVAPDSFFRKTAILVITVLVITVSQCLFMARSGQRGRAGGMSANDPMQTPAAKRGCLPRIGAGDLSHDVTDFLDRRDDLVERRRDSRARRRSRKRLGQRADALAEKLGEWAQLAVLQGDDRDRMPCARQFNRQSSEKRMLPR